MNGLTLIGGEMLVQRLQALGTKAPQAAGAALFREAERIITAAKALVPVDTGALRGSGTVALPEVSGTMVTVAMGFGGPAVDYAVIVHEDLLAFHPNGTAKYLERPIDGARVDLDRRVAADLRPALETGA